jgi:hypothetical protein
MSNTSNTVFIVEKQSGVDIWRVCILGSGVSAKAALEDAYGPKPWSPYIKKSAKNAIVREITLDEFDKIQS